MNVDFEARADEYIAALGQKERRRFLDRLHAIEERMFDFELEARLPGRTPPLLGWGDLFQDENDGPKPVVYRVIDRQWQTGVGGSEGCWAYKGYSDKYKSDHHGWYYETSHFFKCPVLEPLQRAEEIA